MILVNTNVTAYLFIEGYRTHPARSLWHDDPDSKVLMDHLVQSMGLTTLRGRPVELLTLSTCQTAAGDDRAALGLAGIAVRARARSALFTRRSINDPASASPIAESYKQDRTEQSRGAPERTLRTAARPSL